MTVTTLKKNLKTLSNDDLVQYIVDLYKKDKFVKDYFDIEFSKNNQNDLEIFNKYKNTIEHEFFPTRGHGKARISKPKKAISEYKKISNNQTHIAELMIFYVENGVQFTFEYGDINDQFYTSMGKMYEDALKHIKEHGLKDAFRFRCKKIVTDTVNMGWGFHDMLERLHNTYCRESLLSENKLKTDESYKNKK